VRMTRASVTTSRMGLSCMTISFSALMHLGRPRDTLLLT
jgi:hypothetical protein